MLILDIVSTGFQLHRLVAVNNYIFRMKITVMGMFQLAYFTLYGSPKWDVGCMNLELAQNSIFEQLLTYAGATAAPWRNSRVL